MFLYNPTYFVKISNISFCTKCCLQKNVQNKYLVLVVMLLFLFLSTLLCVLKSGLRYFLCHTLQLNVVMNCYLLTDGSLETNGNDRLYITERAV